MKYAQIREGFVVELIPETDTKFPGIPITERFSAEFMTTCEAVDDMVQVGYKKTDTGFEPVPAPEPVPVALDGYRTQAKDRLEGYCSGAIYGGCHVTCSEARGKKHYSFPDEAQRAISLMFQGTVAGNTAFSYKADDEQYNIYSADEVKILFRAVGNWITINTKYKEALISWIDSEEDQDVLNSIVYGSQLPTSYITTLVTYLTSLGINIADFADDIPFA